MNDQQQAAERTVFEKTFETREGYLPVWDGISAYRFKIEQTAWEMWQAALAQREPVAEGEVANMCHRLRVNAASGDSCQGVSEDMAQSANLLERTEAARLAAENRPCCPYGELIDATPENQRETMLHDALTERDELQAQLTAERERSEKLVGATSYALGVLAMQNPPDWYRRLDNAWKAYHSSKENGG